MTIRYFAIFFILFVSWLLAFAAGDRVIAAVYGAATLIVFAASEKSFRRQRKDGRADRRAAALRLAIDLKLDDPALTVQVAERFAGFIEQSSDDAS